MSLLVEIGVVFLVFLGLLAAGMAVPFAIGVPGLVYLLLHGGLPALKGLGLMSWGSMNSFTLTAMPLFILMAEIIQRSGLSHRTYQGLAKLVSPVPGGLLQTNIAACALFAAINGSSVATAATIGSVALPQLKKRGYSRSLSAGSLAAGGTLGILIPPSLAMIVYGSFTETSVAKLFMAGVVPGLLLTTMFMMYIGVHAIWRPQDTPKEPGPQTRGEFLRAIGDLLPFVFLIGGTMGTLYLGWATPTEAAALGCLLSIVLSKIWGNLTWSNFRESLRQAVRTSGNLLFIIYAAYIFAYAITVAGAGEEVTSYVVGLKLSRTDLFIALFLLYTLMGCLVESLGMIVITVPLLHPVLISYGVDPIWFGVILVVFIELGQISPPIGINLFVIQSISKGKFSEIVLGTVPFHLIMFVLLVLLVSFPSLALWLPAHMLGSPR
jgi:tripartite ATP-independent transporter DctM subunit